MVAIVGNDAVLAATPATPVQLAHACLRRGFSVAVPASWGDELVAAETVRRLASRERGPAVMCVCPYVRSRLLAPGPDLAPFLVSVVSPPVAAARYLRAAYGEHAVHITYIGGCPSAEDAAIDVRLTPDDFFADLAEHGIALSEQPLVFDSIVPPDRRRWSSLPGGVPSAEALADGDTRTVIEIDQDDASTDLAQHILAREHVLLDLAPGFGCACSGAVGSVSPRAARAGVTSLEPPRSLGPVIDSALTVTLDSPIAASALGIDPSSSIDVPAEQPIELPTATTPVLEEVLDEILGAEVVMERVDLATEPTRDGFYGSDVATAATIDEPFRVQPEVREDVGEPTPSPATDIEVAITNVPEADVTLADAEIVATAAAPEPSPSAGELTEEQPQVEPELSVRRRTPASVHARYSSAAIPKATSADGRPLPRAYVAKRRTPPAGAAVIAAVPAPPAVTPSLVAVEALPTEPDVDTSSVDTPPTTAPVEAGEEVATVSPPVTPAAQSADPRPASAPAASGSSAPEPTISGDAEAGAGSIAAPASNQGTFAFLLVTALVALGVFVLFSLRR